MPCARRGIENGIHRRLDAAFGAVQCRVRVNRAAQNFAILRRIAMSLQRQENTAGTGQTPWPVRFSGALILRAIALG
jgi:predicted transposase YbfD/YdcC